MATFSVTYSFVANTKARSNEVNTNFSNVLNILQAHHHDPNIYTNASPITNSGIAANAQILATQLQYPITLSGLISPLALQRVTADKGGTGLLQVTQYDLLMGNSGNTWGKLAKGTANTFVGVDPTGTYVGYFNVPSPGTNIFTAGEALTANDCVILGDGNSYPLLPVILTTSNSVNQASVSGSNWAAITFTVPTGTTVYLKSISLKTNQTQNGGQPAATTTARLRATSGGLPTGADLDTGTNTDNTFSFTSSNRTYNFSGAVALTGGNTYAIVLSTSAGSYQLWGNCTSTDSGSTWGTPTLNATPAHYLTFYGTTTAGYVYKAHSAFLNGMMTRYIGFAQSTVSANASITVTMFGTLSGFTSLSVGSDYYISDTTAGAITATAPSRSKKVGVAVASNTLMIMRDKSNTSLTRDTGDGTYNTTLYNGVPSSINDIINVFVNGTSYTAPCDGFINVMGPTGTTVTVDGQAFSVTQSTGTHQTTMTIFIKKGKTWSTSTASTTSIWFTGIV